MSDFLVPIKWVTRGELEKHYPVTAKWPRSSLAARAEALLELQTMTNLIEDLNIIGIDGKIHSGEALRVWDEATRMGIIFEMMYDHGQAD